ncbi:MAG: carbamoylphosphate synthase large subunit [Oscillospiraceae bacterium]|nr:carbamoylphosphate synthase large subunit [Oscillospiraceae bacterium]MBR3185637.1 carbamoylphosphate synthase large subunit [Oscillospiraceae bacterium]HAJ65898.1 carbamoylphosphate synthase large subunit [Clostridiales bacterium]
MKNVIFISPNFPVNYWQFCHELRCDGVNVLGIGDQPYDELRFELKSSLTEYYKVSSLEDYDQVYRAVAFFIFKYGRIDFLESNNEYWLEQDAHLRSDFNIAGGFRVEDVPRIKYKSGMKEYYRRAGIPTARFHMVGDAAGCRAFIKEVGWPVIVKPDNGVGAVATYKLENEEQLDAFLSERDGRFPYIMEEFIDGQINSYDAIIDSRGEPLFETGNITGIAIMDIVNNRDNSLYHILKELPEDTRAFGRAAVKSFGVKSRFVHFEFFRLTRDQHIGKKGQLVALEVNMRPSGGYTPDMINFAHSTNVYKIWADMVAFDRSKMPVGEHRFCACVGRRDGKHFRYSHEELAKRYAAQMRMMERLPAALAEAMGDQLFLAVFDTQEELDAFYRDAVECV